MNSFLHGKLITHMTVDYTDSNAMPQQDVLHFFYDAQSRPAQVKFNGVIYTYVHNLQGDIVGLLDSAGVLAVEYKYDAWGKPLSVTGNLKDTLGKRNPFRYRGYVYDEETGLYYLRSRYYNPEVGRFVNADVIIGQTEALLTNNVFVYCLNNPLRMIDDNGDWPSLGNLLTAAFIAVTTVVVAAAVVATAGAAGAAVGVAAGMYLGTSAATSVAIGTAATVGAYCVAGGVVACGVNDVAEQVTGTNVIANAIGSDTYETIQYGLYGIAGASIATSNYGYKSPRKKISVDKAGKLVPSNHKDEGYYGIRYKVYKPGASNYSLRSIEFHTHDHHGYNPHWQLNYWNPKTMGVSGKKYWTWYGRRIQ